MGAMHAISRGGDSGTLCGSMFGEVGRGKVTCESCLSLASGPARLVRRPRPATMNDVLGDEATAEFARRLKEQSDAAAERKRVRGRGLMDVSMRCQIGEHGACSFSHSGCPCGCHHLPEASAILARFLELAESWEGDPALAHSSRYVRDLRCSVLNFASYEEVNVAAARPACPLCDLHHVGECPTPEAVDCRAVFSPAGMRCSCGNQHPTGDCL